VVRFLLVTNVVLFLLQLLVLDRYLRVLGLVPAYFLGRGYLWQILTYMFLHGNILHILINMLFLWMLGSEIERYWGSREFLRYYLVTGAGAGLVNVLAQPSSRIPTIGASGAIFGLIIAFAMAFPERELLLYFFFRIKAKYFAVLAGAIELVALFMIPNAPIARFAHLGGLVVGFVYIKRERLLYTLVLHYRRWQNRRQNSAEERRQAMRLRNRQEVDRLLDKINREGIGALTDRERDFLERMGGKRR
jgi:membrane associated rhomboid family serine protease